MTIHGRVFCIGMNKTGTTTIKRCFSVLGIKPIAPNSKNNARILCAILDRQNYEPALRLAERYRGFEDRPWNVWEMYRKLDERFPGSRFILSVRNPESWWRSVERWISVTKPWIAFAYRRHLRAENLLKESMIAGCLGYEREVVEYFRGRDDLLVLDLEKGEGWAPICKFLDVPVPDKAFPHANRQHYDKRDPERENKKRLRKAARGKLAKARDAGKGVPCHYCGARATRNLAKRGSRLRSWLRRTARHAQTLILESRPGARPSPSALLERLRREQPGLAIDDMAVVSAHFHPAGDSKAVEGHRAFRERIRQSGLPLLTVEFALGDAEWQLEGGPEEILQVRGGDAIWQRERLLNLGIQELLRRGYGKIVWLDSNIEFEDPESWPWVVAAELERTALCQVFDRAALPMNGGPSRRAFGIAEIFSRGGPLLNRLLHWSRVPWTAKARPGVVGGGWAARAEVLREVPLYDAAILGGADRMLFAACHPYSDEWFRTISKFTHYPFPRCARCRTRISGPEYNWHFSTWAQRWSAAIGGRAGRAPQSIRLHPDPLARVNDRDHRVILLRHEYNPVRDLKLNSLGCWEWASDKPGLHQEVRETLGA